MRRAAWAAVFCAVALSGGCDSHTRSAINHPRVREGTIRQPDLERLARRRPVSVDFVSGRRGYLATEVGLILRTNDGGVTWAAAGAPIRNLADIDFISARHGFAITRRNVLLSTHDGAHSWQRVHRFPPDPNGFGAGVVFVDPTHAWVLPSSGPLYRTRDSGRTWDPLSLPCGEYDHPAGPSFLDERSGYLVCGGQPAAGNQEKALYVTNDGGDTWTERSGTYVLHPNAGRTVPATGYASGLQFRNTKMGLLSAARGGIFRTQTGGLTWRQVFYAEDIGDFTWPTSRRLFALFSSGALRSDDAGGHWRRVFPPGFADPSGPIAFFSSKEGIAFGAPELLGDEQAVLATHDRGRTWFRRGEVPQLRGLIEQVFRFGRVVLVTDGNTLVRSEDRGRQWRRISALPSQSHGWFSFVSADVGFFADDRHRLSRTDDGGSTWKVVAQKTRQLQGAVFVSTRDAFVVDYGPPPPDDGTKHLGPLPRLLHSDDGGKSWGAVDTPLENLTGIYALDDEHWWIFASAHCTLAKPCRSGQILRTADGGRHWDLVLLPATLDVQTASFASATVGFAGAPAGGLYRTNDGGVTWSYVYPG